MASCPPLQRATFHTQVADEKAMVVVYRCILIDLLWPIPLSRGAGLQEAEFAGKPDALDLSQQFILKHCCNSN